MKTYYADSDGTLVVHIKCRRWDTAGKAAAAARDEPPTGYSLVSARITNRNKNGKRASLRLAFERRAPTVPDLTTEDLRTLRYLRET